jgi:hypothetical protein
MPMGLVARGREIEGQRDRVACSVPAARNPETRAGSAACQNTLNPNWNPMYGQSSKPLATLSSSTCGPMTGKVMASLE